MDWADVLKEIAFGGGKTALIMTAVLMPLMVVLELIKDARLLERAARFLRPVMRLFTLPKEGAFPLLVGVFFGISFGSGVILHYAANGSLNRRDMTLIGVFLAVCHGMIEDPLIFAAVGANWWIVVGVRLSLVLVIMMVLSRLFKGVEIGVSKAESPTESG